MQLAFPEATLLGVDASAGMLALAPRGYDLATMDASNLALAPDAFDLVMLAFVLFHLREPRLGLAEARRVLRPGGVVATVTWGTELESEATRIWTRVLDDHGAQQLDADSEPAQHALMDTPEKIATLLDSAGLVSIRSWAERHERRIGAEHLLRLRTSFGGSKRRFDSLDPGAQSACLDSARRRLELASPEDFVASAQVVYSVASAP
jgi:SAM-dependent methyltransferase